jgi:hypothetical protein
MFCGSWGDQRGKASFKAGVSVSPLPRRRREIHLRTPYPSAKPTIRTIAISSIGSRSLGSPVGTVSCIYNRMWSTRDLGLWRKHPNAASYGADLVMMVSGRYLGHFRLFAKAVRLCLCTMIKLCSKEMERIVFAKFIISASTSPSVRNSG